MIAARATELRITAANMNSIRKALLRGATDQESFITRQDAIAALIVFSDEEIRPVMERIAATDTYAETLKDGQRRYPVRNSASAWLRTHPR
jgi:hypothetical protein